MRQISCDFKMTVAAHPKVVRMKLELDSPLASKFPSVSSVYKGDFDFKGQ